MAAELPYASDPSHKPAAAVAAAATRRVRFVSWTTVASLVFIAFNLAVSVRRVRDDRREVAFVVFSYLNLALIICALHCFEVSPQGFPERGRARLAVWLLTTMLTTAFMWKVGEVLPLGLAVVTWVVGAASVAGGFYVLFLHDYEKPSAESLIMRDCERDGEDLCIPAS